MKYFVLTIVSTYILGLVCEQFRNSKNLTLSKLNRCGMSFLMFALICTILIYISGIRHQNFADTGSYIVNLLLFDGDSLKDCWDVLSWDENNAFYALSDAYKVLFGYNQQTYLTLTAVFLITPIMFVYYKNHLSMELASLIFISCGSWVATMNGMKQFAAAVILFVSFPLIYKKKWYIYFPLILIFTMQFHRSSVIFIFIYILCNIKTDKMPYIILLLGMLLFISYPVTGSLISDLLEGSSYQHYSTSVSFGGEGSNPMRVIIATVPFLMGIFCKKSIQPHEKYYNIVMCMEACSVIFYLLGIFFKYYARFAIYTNLFTPFLLDWVIRYFPKKKFRPYVYLFVIGYNLLYFFLEYYVSLGWRWDTPFTQAQWLINPV